MPVYDIFSKRSKNQEAQGQPEIYKYDELPQEFRIQVLHIWDDAIGCYFVPVVYSGHSPSPANKVWEFIHDALAREHGMFCLGNREHDPKVQCKEFLLTAKPQRTLDIIEFSFRAIDRIVRDMSTYLRSPAEITQNPDDAIDELNHRFREHRIGYQYVSGKLVRVDSQLIHSEVVKAALKLLNMEGFQGPEEEFQRAFEHHRKDDHKEAVSEALKAFESTMKAICTIRKWPYPPNATAKPLLDILFKNGLIPTELESHFSGLRSAIESGLPTISNKMTRHGQGPQPTTIPPHLAALALHLTAANIVFLVEAHKACK